MHSTRSALLLHGTSWGVQPGHALCLGTIRLVAVATWESSSRSHLGGDMMISKHPVKHN